jgi:hypothetical protein
MESAQNIELICSKIRKEGFTNDQHFQFKSYIRIRDFEYNVYSAETFNNP